ncbi:hypothetical protein T459_28429 [Capsicum annuum]|uniref:FAD-binding PCMH-type domain-containing protein n=1 Tax=Capsicum annuum TaxID=4072 RepID=A0A2G2YGR2_CAPAN|nr:hypothetical protein T459_28429 [Capsicum annuum]
MVVQLLQVKALGTPEMVFMLFMKVCRFPCFSMWLLHSWHVANLCRCTGYRPIADACKTFVADVDIEDLGINSFWEKGDSKETKVSKLPPYDPTKNFSTYPEFLKRESTKNLDSSRYPWYSPVSIEELRSLLNSKVMENDASYASFKLVVGNTCSVHYKETQRYNHYVDIKHVPEPSIINEDQTGIEVGATVTIAKFISFLNEESKIKFGSYGKLVSEKLAYHMEKIILFDTYRAAPPPHGNALAYVNVSFQADVSLSQNDILINNIQLAFGDYGTKHATRAKKVEEYLNGKILNVHVLYDARKLVKLTVVPEDGTLHPENRSSLAVNFVFEFLYPFTDVHSSISGGLLGGINDTAADEVSVSSNDSCISRQSHPTRWRKNCSCGEHFMSPSAQVADSQRSADVAAMMALVEYDTENIVIASKMTHLY